MFKKLPPLEAEAESTTAASTSNNEPAVPATPAADNAGAESATVDWGAEADAMEADEGLLETPEKPVAESTPALAPVVPATPAPVAAVVPPAAPVAPVAAPVVAPVPEPAIPLAPAPVTKTPEVIAAETAAADAASKVEEEKTFNGLVEYYKLPEDLQIKLSTEPENVLPFLAAKLHQTIAANLTSTINRILPQTIQQVQAVNQAEVQAKNAFYSRWSNLVGKEEAVLQVGALFRRLNPNATAEEAIEMIGKTTCQTLGIPFESSSTAPAATPVAPKPVFTPAGGGGGARSVTAPASDNLFTQLAEELLQEEA
jgi:hypothetical protein